MTEYTDPVFGTSTTQEQAALDQQIKENGEAIITASNEALEQRRSERQKAAFREYVDQKIREWTNAGGSEASFRETYTEGALLKEFLDTRESGRNSAQERRVAGHTPVF